MASINASTSGAGGVITTADNTGILNLQSGGTTVATVSSSGFAIGSGTASANISPFTMKNRIINGDMVVSQRNGTSSVTPTNGQYTLDRWAFYVSQSSKLTTQQNAGSVTPPAGFTNYLGVTSSSAYTVGATDFFTLAQNIEGFNVADLNWGTANAQTVTLSFWVRSSLTGTFGGVIQNGSGSRYYPFSYTISSANTWTKISITIAGDTTGTWATDNTLGIQVRFGLGVGSTFSGPAGSWSGTTYASVPGAVSVVGTNGATFYITGVQLEVGTQATSFEWIPYSTELALCQRYFEKSYDASVVPGANSTNGGITMFSSNFTSTSFFNSGPLFKVTKRTSPTMVVYSPGGTQGKVWNTSDVDTGAGIVAANIGDNGPRYFVATVTAVGALGMFSFQFTASAEL
jgi:hypothetical protein